MNEQIENITEQAAEAAMTENGLEERLRAIEERERALALREREIRFLAALRERDLPESLIRCLDLSSDERAAETLETLAAAFAEALALQLRERLGAEPPLAPAAAPADGMDDVRAAMGLAVR